MSTPADRKAKIQAVAPKQRSIVPWIAGALVLLLLAGGIGFALWKNADDQNKVDEAIASLTAPPHANADKTGIVVNPGKAKAGAPVVALYQDYQCPVCKVLEDNVGDALEKAADDGTISLEYRTMTFLDGNLKNDSSTRSAQAAACADGVGAYAKYHDAIYANQPAQEGAGYTDKQLTEDFTKAAGVTGSRLATFKACYADKKMAGFVTGTNAAAGKAGVTGTPTVKVNGKVASLRNYQHPDLFIADLLATK